MLIVYEKLKTNLKFFIKKIIGIKSLYYEIFVPSNANIHNELLKLSNDQLLSLMRHESHRIEKAVYNNILESKKNVYCEKKDKLNLIYQTLEQRGFSKDEPTIVWSRKIYNAFENLEKDFILPNSPQAPNFDPTLSEEFIEFLAARRSVRVWSEDQPKLETLEAIAYHMIDAARWSPTSGNRQPWRFLILKTPEEKKFLEKIKEEHCISAPLLIFIGMDTRLYGALGREERSVFIDAGAAIMQMTLLAHRCGLGVCWNHFADDLIESRDVNKEIYANFANNFHIPVWIAPIAILAIGRPKFIPPVPARMDLESLMIYSVSSMP